MADREFLVPDLGEGLMDVTVVQWLVAPGEEVALNQPVVLVETAKAEVEVPSPYAGTVVTLGGDEGDTLAVGALLVSVAVAEPVDQPRPTLVGYGPDPRSDRSRRPPPSGSSERPRAKPPVRNLALQLGVDLSAVTGTGPDGVITRSDVEAAGRAGSKAAGSWDVIAVTGVRARVAEQVARSRARIPDATCGVDVDFAALLAARDELRRAEPVVTPFALVCWLAIEALRAAPVLNATYVEDGPEIRVWREVHLGIGTATERGLVVAVVRDAHRRDALDLARQLAEVTEGARAGTLPPEALRGSTFTVSNFGALGLDHGIPVINHPEAGILGVGGIRERPWVVAGSVVVRPVATLTLAFDHRVCDGTEAAAFLTRLRDLVESPEAVLESEGVR